jgi:predicted TIM-barrel fold metal-dependent hydrolase
MQIIDAHCHIGQGRRKKLTPSQLIAEMDACGVDQAVVCPVDEHITVFNRGGNDYILRAVREHPDRFIGFATVNPWYGEGAVKELKRAVNEGLRGLKLHSALQGYFINDDLIAPVIEAAVELGIPVYFHTGTPIHALPLQLSYLAADFPQVDFIMGHAAHADYWLDLLPAVRGLGNIYIETSLRSSTWVLQSAVDELGSHRVMFGSDSPVSSIKVELAKIETLDLDAKAREMVLGGAILSVLKRRQ